MVESGHLVAQSWALDVATDRSEAARTEPLHQQHAQPVAHVRQGQGWCPLLPVWLKISAVSTPLKLLRLGVYWITGCYHDFHPEERL
jgi:hypothetical protein